MEKVKQDRMKITSTSKVKIDVNSQKNNLATQPTVLSNTVKRDSVSFGSGTISNLDKMKTGITKMMGSIERQGFFVEFLLVDAISMIIPRIIIGLGRDSEKTGKINYKSGLEEAGREVLSGPSMVFIPAGILEVARRLQPATNIPRETMKELSSTFEDVVKTSDAASLSKTKDLNESIASKLFDKAFAGFKFKEGEHKTLKDGFVEALNNNSSDKKELTKLAEKFEAVVVSIMNKNIEKTPQNTKQIILAQDEKGNALVKTSPKELFEDFKNYSKDVIEKFVKRDVAKETPLDFIKKIQDFRKWTRMGASVASFAAVGAFLWHLPKIYQLSNISPAQESAMLAQECAKKGGANENK